MKKYTHSTILLLALTLTPPMAGLMLTACSRSVSRNTRTTPDDATITTRVKTALLNDPEIKGKIDVDTFNGVVTLSGSVQTAVERDKALAIARKINGVSDVKSTVQVQ